MLGICVRIDYFFFCIFLFSILITQYLKQQGGKSMDRNNDQWHYDLSAFNNLDQWKAAPCPQVVSFPQWLLPNGIYPSEMSAVITAALRDSQMKGSRWWSCSVFFTLTPSASPSFFFFFWLQISNLLSVIVTAGLPRPWQFCLKLRAHRAHLLSPLMLKGIKY